MYGQYKSLAPKLGLGHEWDFGIWTQDCQNEALTM